MSISPEAIEKVAVAIWEATGHRPSDWIYMAPEVPRKQRYMSYATAALSAAAPAIQAAALRDAAGEVDDRAEQFDTINDNPKDHEYETLVRYGAYAGEARSSAYRLRARADQLEGKTK